MTPEPRDEPEISPADEHRVSDLLASLREDSPAVPEDVSGRLDGTLAGLVAERSGRSEHTGAPVTRPAQQPTQRRNRRWPKVLVAAAAVSVVGLGVGNIISDGSLDMSTNSSGGDAAAPEAGLAEERSGADEPGALAPSEDDRVTGLDAGERRAFDRLRRLRSDSLGPGAQRLADLVLVEGAAVDDLAEAPPARETCDLPETGQDDDRFAVRLDGEPATIVYQPAEDGVRRADVYSCDDASTPLATTFVTTD